MKKVWSVLVCFCIAGCIIGVRLLSQSTVAGNSSKTLPYRNWIPVVNISGTTSTVVTPSLGNVSHSGSQTLPPQVPIQSNHNQMNVTNVAYQTDVIHLENELLSSQLSSQQSSSKCKWNRFVGSTVSDLFTYGMTLDCPNLFKKVHHYSPRSRQKSLAHGLSVKDHPDKLFIQKLVQNCTSTYLDFRNRYYVAGFEKNFPIAFEMLVYYKPLRIQQFIRLLRNIYRPQNAYCIHIDKKSPKWWTEYFQKFASCFPNMVLAKNPVDVVYATSGILYAHLKCFDELMNSDLEWKYVISLHGTELPLLTNRQMVLRLKQMNGANIISSGFNASDKHSIYHSWISHAFEHNRLQRKVNIATDYTIYKSASSANSAISKSMVQFMLKDEKAIDLKKRLKLAKSAVEFYFTTINNFHNAPGGVRYLPSNFSMPRIAKRDWIFPGRKPSQSIHSGFCEGRRVHHNICIVSSYDLPRLWKASTTAAWWFHNKYFIEYDHTVMDCMETLLLQRNEDEYRKDCHL